jgi:hypothetical protein
MLFVVPKIPRRLARWGPKLSAARWFKLCEVFRWRQFFRRLRRKHTALPRHPGMRGGPCGTTGAVVYRRLKPPCGGMARLQNWRESQATMLSDSTIRITHECPSARLPVCPSARLPVCPSVQSHQQKISRVRLKSRPRLRADTGPSDWMSGQTLMNRRANSASSGSSPWKYPPT